MSKNGLVVTTLAVALCVTLSGSLHGRMALDAGKGYQGGGSLVGPPAHGLAGHRVGQIVLGVNNNGTFGSQYAAGAHIDFFTGQAVPSCEYPKGSGIQYLFGGAFWIGAVMGRDTLVSVGADGWQYVNEMYPDEAPFGNMIKRSIIDPSKPEFQGAISEEDYIAVYTDTYTRGIPNDWTGRSHRPLHIHVQQSSFAWSYSYAEDLVLFDYKIANIGVRTLENVYMGIYVDADVCYDCQGTNGFADDLCGFVHTLPAFCKKCEYIDTVNMAWIADNDGDLNKERPAPHVTATRIVRTPAEELDVSFNWWIGNGNPSLDFGPREQSEKGRWPERFRDFGTGGLGTPEGDRNKYYSLRNREFDYDQAYTAKISEADTLWLYPNQGLAADFANGYDTRYLLSFGPFRISPGDELPISFAYFAGPNFHRSIGNDDFLPDDPERYYANLNFADLGENARWASWIYDNPGVDTDDNGYSGEQFVCVADSAVIDSTKIDSIWTGSEWEYIYRYIYLPTLADTCFTTGDRVPDFRGASPPPAPSSWINHLGIPAMRVLPEVGKVTIKFNGLRSENTKDVFSDLVDFEGYRVYYSRDERSSSFSVLASYDVEDYNKFVWDPYRPGGAGYVLPDIPYGREELQCAYGDSCGGTDFDPLAYSPSNPFIHPLYPESLFYFRAQDYNVSELGVATDIRKPFDVPYPTTLIPEEAPDSELTDDGFLKYYEYEIVIEDLLPTVPYWFNVTAFDFGSPQSGLPSLESSVTFSAERAYPLSSVQEVAARNLPVYVYPNPYRVDAGYLRSSFETTRVEGQNVSEGRARRIHFANLPPRCTISIFSLDGDLVREIRHYVPESDPEASHDYWDLITRNTQSAVSGIYYWTVEDDEGNTQIGKLVLIM